MSGGANDLDLKGNEQILWMGKPLLKPFIFSPYAKIIAGFLLLYIWTVVLVGYLAVNYGEEFPKFYVYFILAAGFLPGFAALFLLYKKIEHKNLRYAVTDNRVIIESGLFVKKTLTIELDTILRCRIYSTFVDNMYGSGSIMLDAGELDKRKRDVYHALYSIPNVLTVSKLLECEILG